MPVQANVPLHVDWVRLAVLKPDPRNPRKHAPSQIRQIANSMRAFGNNVPILVDDHDRVISGHARLLAAKQLGCEKVPVIRLGHLTDVQTQAFMIADNRLSEHATWDKFMLGEIFAELSVLNLDFELDVTGFSIGEIDPLIEGITSRSAADLDDEPPEVALGPAVTRLGDRWQLGRHQLLCDDATSARAYQALMQGERADLVVTDPPYNLRIDGCATGTGSIHHREFAMASGEMTKAEFRQFLATTTSQMAANSRDGSLHYIFMDWRHQQELLDATGAVYTELKAHCVWVKDAPGMGSFYRSQHEFVFVFKHGTSPHRNNIQLGRYGRNRSNVWTYPSVGIFGRRTEEGQLLAMHPTVKPVALVADLILDASARRDIVLDPFLGSGTTLIACERVGRRCRGMEIDPHYVDTAIRRWQRHSGQDARHLQSGKSFNERAAAAAHEDTDRG